MLACLNNWIALPKNSEYKVFALVFSRGMFVFFFLAGVGGSQEQFSINLQTMSDASSAREACQAVHLMGFGLPFDFQRVSVVARHSPLDDGIRPAIRFSKKFTQ